MIRNEATILVTGATGNVGGQVVAQLLQVGARVRVLTRNTEASGVPDNVDVVRGDLSAPDTLESSLHGVDAVFLVWPVFSADGADRPLHVLRQHGTGVRNRTSSPSGHRQQFGVTEALVPSIAEVIVEVGS